MDPPKMGEHTRELLRAMNYTDAQIDELRAQAVIN
jgi:crotonobetainyl-CoA:carnitine CoA-transferase CaiB-like acyl-CoA transferase